MNSEGYEIRFMNHDCLTMIGWAVMKDGGPQPLPVLQTVSGSILGEWYRRNLSLER